jgi:AbiU2
MVAVEASRLKKPLNAVDALGRARLISPRLRENVETADVSSILLNAANDTIPKGLGSVYIPFGRAYSGVQNALALKLAMDLARIFDLSRGKNARPAEEQTKASIPVLAGLLTRHDVQGGLLQNAAEWIADISYRSLNVDACQKAITDFLTLAQGLEVEDTEENAALVRIRQFRDFRLAHSLFDQEPDALPIYADLERLLGIRERSHQTRLVCGRRIQRGLR